MSNSSQRTNPVPRGGDAILTTFGLDPDFQWAIFLDTEGNLWATGNGGNLDPPPDPKNPQSGRKRLVTGVMSFLTTSSSIIILQQDASSDNNFDICFGSLRRGDANPVPFPMKVDAIDDWFLSTSGSLFTGDLRETIFASRRSGSLSRFDADWTDAEINSSGSVTLTKTIPA